MISHANVLQSYTAAVALCAAVMDVRSRRIPNWFTLPTLVGALILQVTIGGLHALALSFVASVLAGSLFLVLFLAGGMGGGDVKLIAAIAAGIGLSNTGALLVLTALCGGVMAIVVIVWHRRVWHSVRNVGRIVAHHCENGLEPHPELNVRNKRNLRLPYALAITAGTLLTISLEKVGQ
ncbi:A24 family peptidase [Terriglobus roseus]|uniref:Prepilin peptidase CpaA n=1 Tax=Terriglobus roseus TaxID=392734 RepID=A0A1G7PBL8_9BACT|nr:prepilin peptidase [Terriglobus roseus]SDF83673.1 prepilin peptidase CpaA [Terriglobus roseus]